MDALKNHHVASHSVSTTLAGRGVAGIMSSLQEVKTTTIRIKVEAKATNKRREPPITLRTDVKASTTQSQDTLKGAFRHRKALQGINTKIDMRREGKALTLVSNRMSTTERDRLRQVPGEASRKTLRENRETATKEPMATTECLQAQQSMQEWELVVVKTGDRHGQEGQVEETLHSKWHKQYTN